MAAMGDKEFERAVFNTAVDRIEFLLKQYGSILIFLDGSVGVGKTTYVENLLGDLNRAEIRAVALLEPCTMWNDLLSVRKRHNTAEGDEDQYIFKLFESFLNTYIDVAVTKFGLPQVMIVERSHINHHALFNTLGYLGQNGRALYKEMHGFSRLMQMFERVEFWKMCVAPDVVQARVLCRATKYCVWVPTRTAHLKYEAIQATYFNTLSQLGDDVVWNVKYPRFTVERFRGEELAGEIDSELCDGVTRMLVHYSLDILNAKQQVSIAAYGADDDSLSNPPEVINECSDDDDDDSSLPPPPPGFGEEVEEDSEEPPETTTTTVFDEDEAAVASICSTF